MLVLSRKQNQDIVIGDNIKVSVLKVKGNTVRIGIEAPRHVRVVRGELPPSPIDDEPAQFEEITLVFGESETGECSNAGGGTDSQSGLEGPAGSHRRMSDPDEEPTILFQDRLPIELKRNRLKQIVSELTSREK